MQVRLWRIEAEYFEGMVEIMDIVLHIHTGSADCYAGGRRLRGGLFLLNLRLRKGLSISRWLYAPCIVFLL
jgi:hypothetical protein